MNWKQGNILLSGYEGQYKAIIQQIEGKWDLYVCLETPEGRVTKDGIWDWNEAKHWIEGELNNLKYKNMIS